jgi:putative spermidine/putrescine transport system permease protein
MKFPATLLPISVLVLPLVLFLLLAYAVPFLGVAQWSVTEPQLGFSQYARLSSDPLVISVFIRTFRICVIVTLFSVTGAYVVAYVWTRGTSFQRTAIEFCILVPFWISVLTRAFGWLALLSTKGLINTWLISLRFISDPLPLVRNEFGVIVGMTHFLLPFAVFPIASAMRQVDQRVLLAARGLGAGRMRVFWKIFLPMTSSGVLGAALIVFVFALGFFVTPAILGGGRSVMIAELVYLRMFQSMDWGLGAALSVTLVLFVALLIGLVFRFLKPTGLAR